MPVAGAFQHFTATMPDIVTRALRAALTPAVSHMPLAAILAALVALTALFTYFGLRFFDRRAMS